MSNVPFKINTNLNNNIVEPAIYLGQNDAEIPVLHIHVYEDSQPKDLTEFDNIKLVGPFDDMSATPSLTEVGVVSVTVTTGITAVAGLKTCRLELSNDDGTISSSPILIYVVPNPANPPVEPITHYTDVTKWNTSVTASVHAPTSAHPAGSVVVHDNAAGTGKVMDFYFNTGEGSTVSGTAIDDNWATITIDGVTHNIPQGGGGGGEPAAYLKSASVANKVLTLIKKDNTSVVFTPDTITGTISGSNWATLTINGITKNIPQGEPATYLKSASVANKVLTLVDKNNNSIVFTPDTISGDTAPGARTWTELTINGVTKSLPSGGGGGISSVSAITNSGIVVNDGTTAPKIGIDTDIIATIGTNQIFYGDKAFGLGTELRFITDLDETSYGYMKFDDYFDFTIPGNPDIMASVSALQLTMGQEGFIYLSVNGDSDTLSYLGLDTSSATLAAGNHSLVLDATNGLALDNIAINPVIANPTGTGSTDLTKIQIGNDIFNIPSPTNMVTTDTAQTITGIKTMTAPVLVDNGTNHITFKYNNDVIYQTGYNSSSYGGPYHEFKYGSYITRIAIRDSYGYKTNSGTIESSSLNLMGTQALYAGSYDGNAELHARGGINIINKKSGSYTTNPSGDIVIQNNTTTGTNGIKLCVGGSTPTHTLQLLANGTFTLDGNPFSTEKYFHVCVLNLTNVSVHDCETKTTATGKDFQIHLCKITNNTDNLSINEWTAEPEIDDHSTSEDRNMPNFLRGDGETGLYIVTGGWFSCYAGGNKYAFYGTGYNSSTKAVCTFEARDAVPGEDLFNMGQWYRSL